MKLPSSRILWAVVLCTGLYAVAQSRTITIRAVDVDVQGAFIAKLPDGGCTLRPVFALTTEGAQAFPTDRPFGGTRCATILGAAEKAAYLDAQVGDGGKP